YDSDIAAAIHEATDAGARVVNMSLGGDGSSAVLDEAVAYAVSHGVVLVAAAGNEYGSQPCSATTGACNPIEYPAAAPGVLAGADVAAILRTTARPLGGAAPNTTFGYVLVDAAAAVQAAPLYVSPTATGTPTATPTVTPTSTAAATAPSAPVGGGGGGGFGGG